jgi:hypothetical protein
MTWVQWAVPLDLRHSTQKQSPTTSGASVDRNWTAPHRQAPENAMVSIWFSPGTRPPRLERLPFDAGNVFAQTCDLQSKS